MATLIKTVVCNTRWSQCSSLTSLLAMSWSIRLALRRLSKQQQAFST